LGRGKIDQMRIVKEEEEEEYGKGEDWEGLGRDEQMRKNISKYI
jgi:hypothetical protein